jgi:hypothetical protein
MSLFRYSNCRDFRYRRSQNRRMFRTHVTSGTARLSAENAKIVLLKHTQKSRFLIACPLDEVEAYGF